MKDVSDRVKYQAYSQVRRQVEDQVYYRAKIRSHYKVKLPVLRQVMDQVMYHAWNQVEEEL